MLLVYIIIQLKYYINDPSCYFVRNNGKLSICGDIKELRIILDFL